MNITKRQSEIIEVAAKILTGSGVQGLTTKRLAQEMNFSESALYRHFKSKEEILVTMLDYFASLMEEFYSETKGDNEMEKIKSLFLNQYQFFVEHPYYAIIVFSEGLMEESEQIATAVKNVMATRMKFLVPLLSESQQSKLIVDTMSPEDMAHIIMGSNRLLLLKWKMNQFKFDLILEGERHLSNVLNLLKTNK